MKKRMKTPKRLIGALLFISLWSGRADARESQTLESSTSQMPSSHWDEFFPNGLVNARGESISPSVLDGKFVGLFFSASWCGPCKPATSKLIALRNHAGETLEVVLVSQDRSERDQLDHMQASGMEWPAVKWADSRALMSKFSAWGIPRVIVLSPSGEVVDRNARYKIEWLPEENLERLQSYTIDEDIAHMRSVRQSKGDEFTEEDEKDFRMYRKNIMLEETSEFTELLEMSLHPIESETPSSWKRILAGFYRSVRTERQPGPGVETAPGHAVQDTHVNEE